jgi:serine protease
MRKSSFQNIEKLLVFCALVSSCSLTDDIGGGNESELERELSVIGKVLPDNGEFILKLKEDCPETKSPSTYTVPAEKVRDAFASCGSFRMERLFPSDTRFEGRTKREGLDRWYLAKFDGHSSSDEIVKLLEATGVVDVVEFPAEINVDEVSEAKGPVTKSSYSESVSREFEFPFNENRNEALKQWHYNNTGDVLGKSSLCGADANVWAAWSLCQGNSDVIVAVIDQGVKYDHEDLADNMWVNVAELNGVEGVDDDGNGYVDDVYGYNFVSGNASIVWSSALTHGTHVAGTIAAVNNNGKGVNGIAGGSGNGDGVRIMTLQTVGTLADANASSGIAGTVRAIKYAADNGAVICQNSWSYDSDISQADWNRTQYSSVKEAMAYFTKYAGTDDNGDQTGPMKGGLMVFSAGNDNTFVPCYPAADELAVAVAATDYNGARAYYSDYGSWIDISAPGGDFKTDSSNGGVYSTTVGENGESSYGYLQGTSMSCPHVSGACALAVSYYYGKEKRMGLTAEMLREALLSSAADVDINMPEDLKGEMGRGNLDTYALLRYVDPSAGYLSAIEDQMVSKGDIVTLDLSKYFFSTAAITVFIQNKDVVTADLERGVLTITGISAGITAVTLSDATSATRSFTVTVR